MSLLWFLCLLWVLSVADKCEFNHRSLKVPSVLDSLQCYNDYKSYFHCSWREEPIRRLQLWFKRKSTIGECEDYPSDVEGTKACRYKTKVFSPGTTYTVFFDDPLRPCSSLRTIRHDLSVLLKASSPYALTTSSPHPKSSALNNDITYQVDYGSRGHDDWTLGELSNTQKRLDEVNHIPGQGYEARARGLLSHKDHNFQPLAVTDPEQAPRVDCVPWGEQEARCSWEQSIELGHFISYQLVCRHNHTATPQKCCQDPKVSLGHTKDMVKFSCHLELTPSSPMLLELVPIHNAKNFTAKGSFRPDPPTGVTVTKKGPNFVVAWTPSKRMDFILDHEVLYYSEQNEEDAKTIPINLSTVNIQRSSLQPSVKYWVKVRSLERDKRTPSEWSHPVAWTPQADTWQNWIYAFMALVVSALFIVIVVVPACKRRVVLWVESIPSPDKSKVLEDIKTVRNPKLIFNEETYLYKVMDMDSVSTCYSIMSLWPDKMDTQSEDAEDEGVWSCDNLPVSPLDKSALSFSGPYILCPPVESKPRQEPAKVAWPVVGCPVAVTTSQSEGGYVRLPCPAVSPSVMHLPTQSHSSTQEETNSDTQEDTQEDQHCQSHDCKFQAFWPQEGAILGSGYCQRPSDFTHMYSQS